MKRMVVVFDGDELVFRTNNDGSGLFIGVGVNKQISCDGGFHKLSKIKKAIRAHLKFSWDAHHDTPMPMVHFCPFPGDFS